MAFPGEARSLDMKREKSLLRHSSKQRRRKKSNKAMSLHQPIRSSLSFYVIESSRDSYTLKMGHSTGFSSRNQEEVIIRACVPLYLSHSFRCRSGYSCYSCWQASINACSRESSHAYDYTNLEEEEEQTHFFTVWIFKIDRGIIADNTLTGLYGSGNLLA